MKLHQVVIIVIMVFNSPNCIGQVLSSSREERIIIDSVINSRIAFLRECLKAQNDEVLSKKLLENPDSLKTNSLLEVEYVLFFENLTGHKAKVKNMYAMGKAYTSRDIDRWQDWATKHKELLRWERPNRRVNRADFDIYKE